MSPILAHAGPAVLYAAGLVIALGTLAKFLHLGELRKGTRDFLRDWHGEPARPGRDATPSVLERLRSIEKELHPNGGGSMRDDIQTGVRLSQTAAVVAEDAKREAAELRVQLAESSELAMIQRGVLDRTVEQAVGGVEHKLEASVVEVRADIHRTTERYIRLLADHGGPDLTDHLSEDG